MIRSDFCSRARLSPRRQLPPRMSVGSCALVASRHNLRLGVVLDDENGFFRPRSQTGTSMNGGCASRSWHLNWFGDVAGAAGCECFLFITFIAFAVSATTGTPAVLGSALSIRVRVSPSHAGNSTSMSTRSRPWTAPCGDPPRRRPRCRRRAAAEEDHFRQVAIAGIVLDEQDAIVAMAVQGPQFLPEVSPEREHRARPGSLSSEMLPPCSSTSRRVSESPRPVP